MPERTCVGCRGRADKAALVRIVRDDEGYVVDVRQRLPGRGAYLHPGCAGRAVRTRALQRALKAPPAPSEQLALVLAGLGDPGPSHAARPA